MTDGSMETIVMIKQIYLLNYDIMTSQLRYYVEKEESPGMALVGV